MGCSKSSSKREFYSDKCLHQGPRNISNKQPVFTLQGTRKKEEQIKPKVSRRKEIAKIKAETNRD